MSTAIEQLENLEKSKQATFTKVYHPLENALGENNAKFLSFLMNRCLYHVKNHGKKEGDWFYLTQPRAQELTSLGETAQKNRIKALKLAGLIEQRNMGLPNKRHFRLHWENILALFGESGNKIAAELRQEKNKAKATHLPAGRKPKMQSLPDTGTSIAATAEVVSAEHRDINKTQVNKNESTKSKDIKTSTDKTDDNYLKPVHDLRKKNKLPSAILDKIESVIANSTYHNNPKRYQEFCDWKGSLVKCYEQFSEDITILGFQTLFSDYLGYEGEIKNVKGYLCDKADRMLNRKESLFVNQDTNPQYIKPHYLEHEIMMYRRNLSTAEGYFPWEHYNEIMNPPTPLSTEEIEAKRIKWESVKIQLGRAS